MRVSVAVGAIERGMKMTKHEAIIKAFHIAHDNEIAGYAFEIKDGWTASDRKPSLRIGKVIECTVDGKERLA